MKLKYYSWPAPQASRPAAPVDVPTLDPAGERDAGLYVPHPDLTDAVNVALVLGMPLLITGEPGTGKSQLAYSIAHQLGFEGPHKFVAKSTSQARDLFYSYDALGRFYAAEVARLPDTSPEDRQRAKDPLNFVDYAALGRAVLLTHEKQQIGDFLPPGERGAGLPGPRLGHQGKACRSVVLIDEIDKAPRDFTNDLLDEIETLQFRVPEVREAPTPRLSDRRLWPVIIITSNSERPLPDAFLRRCVYFHLPFPPLKAPVTVQPAPASSYTMEDIVAQRLGRDFSRAPMVSQALALFYHLRDLQPRLRKPPATAELLNWLTILREAGEQPLVNTLKAQPSLAVRTASVLLKVPEERQRGIDEIKTWLERR